jgi:nitroreductase
MIKELVLKNRSYRRFYQEADIKPETLREFVDIARLSASGGNVQPLKYILSYTSQKNALIFSCLTWAGYLNDWQGPCEGERPSAYIIILGDTKISRSFGCDYGIAAQNILLSATEKGLGGCMLASIQKDKLRKALKISSQYEILLALALGKPKETVVIDTVKNNDIKYWRDKKQIHHVPKRAIEDIIID